MELCSPVPIPTKRVRERRRIGTRQAELHFAATTRICQLRWWRPRSGSRRAGRERLHL